MAEGDLIQTGIAGLDDILRSSIPKGNVILVEGAAGTGKTLLGMEFIYRGVTQYNEPGLIASFEVAPQKLIRQALATEFHALAAPQGVSLQEARGDWPGIVHRPGNSRGARGTGVGRECGGRGHYLYSHPATSGGRGRRDAVKRSTNFRAQRLVLLQGRLNRLGAGLAPGCFAVWRGMLDLGVDLSPYQ
jgi:KaiC